MNDNYYTSKIFDGSHRFRDFVWRCAKAFVPTLGGPGSLPPDYYDTEVRSREEHLERCRLLLQTDLAKADEAWSKEQKEAALMLERIAREANAERDVAIDRAKAMLREVAAWHPPTPEHQELKDFMYKQLVEGIESNPVRTPASYGVVEEDLDTFKAVTIHRRRESVAYAERNLQKAVELRAKGFKWIANLERSVPRPLAGGAR